MRILVADDDGILRDYIASAIPTDFKDNIDIVGSVDEAIEKIKKNIYDKAIIDLRFDNDSDKDGFDILRCAKEYNVKERIIFTSVSNQMDLLRVGATAAFRKPLSIKKIVQFILTNDYEILKEGELF